MIKCQTLNIIFLFIIIYSIIKYKDVNKFIRTIHSKLKRKKSKSNNQIETWRDLPYIGNKSIVSYNNVNPLNYSRKNLPIYYPISSPLEDEYFNYLNSLSSPKLSLFRNILRSVEVQTNQDISPIKFNYAERPIEIKNINNDRIKVLRDIIINSINKLGKPNLKVEYVNTSNEVHEETDLQSRISFDIKLKLYFADPENAGKILSPDIVYIQPEFIFERKYDTLPEDNFFNNSKSEKFNSYLSKLIVIGSENMGFLGGRYTNTRRESKRLNPKNYK